MKKFSFSENFEWIGYIKSVPRIRVSVVKEVMTCSSAEAVNQQA